MTEKEYMAIHYWVETQLGKPSSCDLCGTTSQRRYEWANISQEYKRELSDWRRLCKPCHATERHPGLCVNGHDRLPENLALLKSGSRYCKVCLRERSRVLRQTEAWKEYNRQYLRRKRAKLKEQL